MGKTKEKDKGRVRTCSNCELYSESRVMKKKIISLQREIERLMATIQILNKDGKNLKKLEEQVKKTLKDPVPEPVVDKCEFCGSTDLSDPIELDLKIGKRKITTCHECGKRTTVKSK